MADSRPIGVFDSGLGGLTVLRELEKEMPNESFVYFGDTSRVPYGTKSNATIRQYALQDEKFLLSKNVKYIIAACGTVSAVAFDTAKELPVKFMGVVENAAKDAVNTTKTKKIGVIGTTATINNKAYEKYISKLCPEAEVTAVDCPLFVPLVETGWIEKDDIVVRTTAERYLAKVKEKEVDTLILGCTHYPVLSEVIKDIMGESVALINAGVSTAKAAKEELKHLDLLNDSPNKQTRALFVSDKTSSFSKVAKILLGGEVDEQSVEQVDITKI